jgi:hypothetical protein
MIFIPNLSHVCFSGISFANLSPPFVNIISALGSSSLIKLNKNNRSILKKAGLLSRNARIKERKKYGLKKARKASQYSKR